MVTSHLSLLHGPQCFCFPIIGVFFHGSTFCGLLTKPGRYRTPIRECKTDRRYLWIPVSSWSKSQKPYGNNLHQMASQLGHYLWCYVWVCRSLSMLSYWKCPSKCLHVCMLGGTSFAMNREGSGLCEAAMFMFRIYSLFWGAGGQFHLFSTHHNHQYGLLTYRMMIISRTDPWTTKYGSLQQAQCLWFTYLYQFVYA